MDLIVQKNVGKDKNQMEYEFLGYNQVRLHRRWRKKSGILERFPGVENCSHYTGEIFIPSQVEDKNHNVYTVTELGTRGNRNGAFFSALEVTQVTVPGTVRVIFDTTFRYCRNLHRVFLNEGTEVIEHGAFYACTELHSINLPDSVREVGNYAFNSCFNLEEIELGRNLAILYKSFMYCGWIRKVKCRSTMPPMIDEETFPAQIYSLAELSVPIESLEKYRIHPFWGQFKTIKGY